MNTARLNRIGEHFPTEKSRENTSESSHTDLLEYRNPRSTHRGVECENNHYTMMRILQMMDKCSFLSLNIKVIKIKNRETLVFRGLCEF